MAALAIKDTGEARVLELSGRLDAASIRGVWSDARRALKEAADRRIVIDAEKVDYCDGAGIGLIVDMLRQRKRGEVEVTNLKPAFSALLKQFDVEVLDHDLDPQPKRGSSIEEIGEIASGVGHDMYEQVSFVGETIAALAYAVRHPSTVRWRDVWLICEKVGADALPIVALISFLLGVILAFQSAIPMKKFAAEIFVAGSVESFGFAIPVHGIGCLRGLQSPAGASAVGDSAAGAVVSGIILLVIVDGICAVLYFFLDI